MNYYSVFRYANAVLKYMLHGGKVVPKHIYDSRADICKTCEHNKNNVCQICGCRLEGDIAIVSKLLMPTESCPINKWSTYSEDCEKSTEEIREGINQIIKKNNNDKMSLLSSITEVVMKSMDGVYVSEPVMHNQKIYEENNSNNLGDIFNQNSFIPHSDCGCNKNPTIP